MPADGACAMLDVVCLSHLRWGFVYQRPNHLMSRCARRRRVFFVEEPVFGDGSPRLVTREVERNLTVATPHLPSAPSGDVACMSCAHRALVDGMLARFAIDRPLLWYYTPMALEHAGHVRSAGVVFDCMDELAAFHGAPPRIREYERELFRRADVVFTGGQSLHDVKRGQHGNVHLFTSSVDAAHFKRARAGDLAVPDDQRRIGRPRLGYFGVIDERIDRDLVARIADSRPDWNVVMVGPVVKIDPAELPRRPNVHYLGPKGYDELPAYIAGWDVAIMPFSINDATRYISPTKTLEYLAAGRPVVSTPIRDVVKPYGEAGVVRVAAAGAFVDAVGEALAEAGSDAAAARQAHADALIDATSWDGTWERMEALIDAIGREPRKVA